MSSYNLWGFKSVPSLPFCLPKGTEIEVWPQLTLCADGFAPSSFSRCDACSPPSAGIGGFCNEVCGPGTQSTGTACVMCAAGQAGDGTLCRDCLPGEFQELPGQITCQQCPRGFLEISSGPSKTVVLGKPNSATKAAEVLRSPAQGKPAAKSAPATPPPHGLGRRSV